MESRPPIAEKPFRAQSRSRVPAIDLLRGLVIVLMALDHASFAFNGDRYVTDSVAFYTIGSEIPTAQFLVRWVTHICAPTFLFLAGYALSLSLARRSVAGQKGWEIDRFLLLRGLFILLLDPLWMSAAFGYGIVFQVLYAIGAGLCAMTFLRRFGPGRLLALSLFLMIGGEALAGLALSVGGGERAGPLGALLVTGGRLAGDTYVLYPLLPWLAYMLLGWALGRMVIEEKLPQPARAFALSGAVSLILFFVIRGLNGYGNMMLFREDASLVQWLHVSKYPPSLSFSSLELGLMCLLLAALSLAYRSRAPSIYNPLVVFGQTPLFFYLLHVHLLAASARLIGTFKTGGLAETGWATLGVILFLYPLCVGYRYLKRAHPDGFLRFI